MSVHLWTSWLASAILTYFLLSRVGNLLLNLLSIRKLRDIERERLLADLPQLHSGLEQPISVLLPLQGKDKSAAVATVQALLRLEHAAFELIVIHDGDNNGDTGGTMDALTQAFDLHPFPETYRMRIPTQAIRGIHRSTRHRNLRIIDKQSGGLADALNAGINTARHPLYCSVDTSMLLRRDCLQRLATPFINENGIVMTVAALHAANDAAIADGLFDKLVLPRRWLPRLQIIELLRNALFAPLGWSVCNAIPHAPSALALLRIDAAIQAGGYDTTAVDPQAELILRLQRTLRAQGRKHGLRFVAEPVCARNVAESWPDWSQQRAAWQHGLCDTLRRNRHWPPARAGLAGWLAWPFTLLCEAWGPLLETFGYLFMLIALVFGLLPMSVFCAFLTVAVGFGILLSLSGVLLEDMALRSYAASTNVATLALSAVVFNLGYVQLDAACRAMAMLQRPQNTQAG
ncbi:glycosyltransferase family 2 protein [Oxalicibacterium solurbis]|uniref:Glycosyl transferase family 2 n=1 Tax=Oxalicibacterium solurbis TaxID=69280 RepID=A0A8J3F5F3_9BURK|nr:glycosyltransferase family 2 protein [Oxalicibacterium solurbis]GGI54004.1 glycosyl transferase family 2 [Oxalicibacterium solurbis]